MGNYKRNYSDLKSCLEDIFCNEGIECLENSGKLVSLLTDLIPQNRGDINMVKRMAEHGVLRDFRKAHTQDEMSRNRAVHAAVDNLVNWESIDKDKAEKYVQIFVQVMQWQTVIISTASEPRKFQQSVMASYAWHEEPKWKQNVLMETNPGIFSVSREQAHNHEFWFAYHMFQIQNFPDRRAISTVTFLDSKPGPNQQVQDVSQEKNGSVVAWVTKNPHENRLSQFPVTYNLFIAADGGINGSVACRMLFRDCENLTSINYDGHFHTDEATDMSWMFARTKLKSLDLSSFNTAKVTNMSYMFSHCNCTVLDVSNFNTGEVEYMNGMFCNCKAQSLDVSNFNTHKVRNVAAMFYKFDGAVTLGKLDFRNVDTYMSETLVGYYWIPVGFMDDSREINGRPWIELFGGQRFEIKAPLNGTIKDYNIRWTNSKLEPVKKGELLVAFKGFGKRELYSPCDGWIIKDNVFLYEKRSFEFNKHKGDLLFVIYSRHSALDKERHID